MKTSRRKFFGLMAAAPIAGKAAAEGIVARQAGINAGALNQLALGSNAMQAGMGAPNISTARVKDALNNPITRSLYESLIYEQERNVSSIDPDIGVHRSTSLAAKIVYQRQRNVARHFEGIHGERIWTRMDNLIRKALGFET